MTNTEVRNLLASFLFTGDDVFKLIGELSGGERGRVSLARLMLSEANFLILDEPTNHLDIVSREVLENALNSYEGTVLFVSHDRYFINRTASRIMELTHQVLVNYPGNNSESIPDKYIGNYDFYVEKSAQVGEKLIEDLRKSDSFRSGLSSAQRGIGALAASEDRSLQPGDEPYNTGRKGSGGIASEQFFSQSDSMDKTVQTSGRFSVMAAGDASSSSPAAGESDSPGNSAGSGATGVEDWKKRKEEQARRRKLENDLKKCEKEIARLEEEGERLDEEVSLPGNSTDPEKLSALTAQRAAVDDQLQELYERWELLSEQTEQS